MVTVTTPLKHASHLDSEACFMYFMEGSNDHYSQISHLHCDAQEGILLNCGNYMLNVTPDEDSGKCQFVVIHFYPEVLKKLYKNDLPSFLKGDGNISPKSGMTLIKQNELLSKYIESIFFFFQNLSLADEDLLCLKLKEIILLLYKMNSPVILEIMQNLFTPRLVSFKDVIVSHLFSPLTIADLAGLTNHSLASFKREFKKIYNNSPANYIKNKRLEKAAQMLKVSEYSISDIAYDCAFQNITHFSRAFKAKYGSTPSDYRMS